MSGEAFLAQPSRRSLSFAAVFAGLGLLTRYTGVTLVLTGILFVLFQSGKELKGRLADAGLFGLLSVSPTVVWIIRNELVSSTAVGDRAPSSMSFQTNLSLTTNTLARWLIHPELNGRAHGLLVVPFVILFLVLLAISTRRHKERPDQDSPRGLGCLVPPVCFAAIYVGTLIVTAARVAFDTIDLRLLSPVYVPLLVAMVCGLDRLVALLKTPNLKRFALAALQTALSIWLIYPVQATTALAADSFRSGWGYASGAWACSPLISYMRQHPPPGHVVSNDPWAVAILTGIPAVPPPEQYYYHSPARNPTSFARFRRQVRSARPLYLVWFEPSPHSFYCHLEEMRSLLQLSLIARFPEGAIYRVESPAAQGPPGRAYLDTLRMEFGATSNSRR